MPEPSSRRLGSALRPDAAGFVYIDRGMFRAVFASRPAEVARLIEQAAEAGSAALV